MKRSQCSTCGEQQEASTSFKMKRLAADHWDKTGHRTYRKIIGWGNYTFPVHPEKGDNDDGDPNVEYEVVTEDDLVELYDIVTRDDVLDLLKGYVPHNTMKMKLDDMSRRLVRDVVISNHGELTDAKVRDIVKTTLDRELQPMKKQMRSLERSRNRALEGLDEMSKQVKETTKTMEMGVRALDAGVQKWEELKDRCDWIDQERAFTNEGLKMLASVHNNLIRLMVELEVMKIEDAKENDLGVVALFTDPNTGDTIAL